MVSKLTAPLIVLLPTLLLAADPDQLPNTWLKRSPVPDGPTSPRLGYESSWGYDPVSRKIIRWGGHNQGGGGEQNAETWLLDPKDWSWQLQEPGDCPPGVCCAQQNVFDPAGGRFIRFPAFSLSHGWQWQREVYLKNSSAWAYDPAADTWRDRHPVPAPRVGPLRCASWDAHHGVIVVFGGENIHEGTVVYDPHANEWKRMNPPTQPKSRSAGNMAYDARRKRHILFGAQSTADPHTWAYDYAANRWTDLRPKEQPPTTKNDAVLAYDSVNDAVIAVVRITGAKDDDRAELQTWAYMADENTWKRMNPPQEPTTSGSRARMMLFIPDRNLVILENRTHPPHGPAEQQIWTYRYAPRPAAAMPVDAPVARTTPRIVEQGHVSVRSAKQAEVSWSPSPTADVVGYHVERADVEVWTDDQLLILKKRTPPLDATPSIGAVKKIGPFTRLTTEPVKSTTFGDTTIDLSRPRNVDGQPTYERSFPANQLDPVGRPYPFHVLAYRVRAVDNAGDVSGPSPVFFTFPGAPQSPFAREAGQSCELKWSASPEKNLQGYRVYRLDGRYDKDPVSRLTPTPIKELAFTDPAAGKSARRYHVVPVDVLGQEGIPSAPVWSNREWKRFYDPFSREWHQ